ncbi:thiolase family protein [Microbacterium sp. H1-D42]|uniref:thiolase family protein n=1 Tax=Microbacterium sp. H1-D42 TaxID=2925844 RepID=UPI001F5346D8|nr:thiolase family protein [Microbacterium sp. H1-D42]UNK71496.1 thiolase family protein [Microbacterium sp. H1-D42]
MNRALILDAARTPRARVRRDGGTLAGLSPAELLAVVLRELGSRGLSPERIDDLVVGVSTVVGDQGGDVGRVAAIHAGWDTVPAGVVSRLCGSGLDAVASAAAQVRSGGADVVVAAGVESMSRVPMLADRPTFALDPTEGEITGFVSIGVSADAAAFRAGFSRAELDEYGLRSQLLASAAPAWESSIAVTTPSGAELAHDEGARPDTTIEALAALPPLFADDPLWERVERHLGIVRGADRGLHTVGTAPQFSDAAAAIVLASETGAAGQDPSGQVLGWGQAAVRSPGLEATAPAARRALDRAGISARDLSVIEVNESFSVTPLLLTRELGVSPDIVNAHGGAIAVGHPLGACGGVLIANALDQLRRKGGGYGLVAIPAALGLATAVVIESFA